MLTLNVSNEVSAVGRLRKEVLPGPRDGDNKSGVEDIGEAENVDNGDSGERLEVFEAVCDSSGAVSRLTVDGRAVSLLGRKLLGVLIRKAARPFVADID
jgi:hypothetical protein